MGFRIFLRYSPTFNLDSNTRLPFAQTYRFLRITVPSKNFLPFLHIYYTIILTKSQIMERPSRVELLNAAFAVRYSADEHWAHWWLGLVSRQPIVIFSHMLIYLSYRAIMGGKTGLEPALL